MTMCAEYLAVRQQSSRKNPPTCLSRRRHPYRWRPKLRGTESSLTVTWKRGKTILIHAGAGAVGAYAVQLARRACGATVIATASGDDEA